MALVLVLDDREGLLENSEGGNQLSAIAHFLAAGSGATVPAIRFLRGPANELGSAQLSSVRAVVLVRERTAVTSTFLDNFPHLELILQTGGHAYHVDVDAATSRGIIIALGRRVQAPLSAVPELVFSLMIGAMRRFRECEKATGQLNGEQPGDAWGVMPGNTLRGKRLGLLGAGRHGIKVAAIARAFGMDVVAWDRSKPHDAVDIPTREDGADGGDVPRLPLFELLSSSDVVSVHLRLSDESRHLLNASTLAKFKQGSVLVNTARGAICDEAALVEALADPTAPLCAAGLDVFEVEPLPADSKLRAMDNCLLTPHIGWVCEETFSEFATIAAEQLNQYLAGKLPLSEVLNRAAIDVPGTRWAGAGLATSS
jgi:phosphoglycerate dehydrogenase-like enzyme